jgi:AraC-like DNA-binding protein
VLPTGHAHIALRLSDDPLRLFDTAEDVTGRVVGGAVLGGPRAAFYVREISKPLCSVGAQLLPGAAEAMFGVPAHELAERHTALQDLWGDTFVAAARERLAELRSLEERLDAFETILGGRVPVARGVHPGIAQALEQLRGCMHVRDVVRSSGCSHRTFISHFTRSVGLTPKLYSRVLRFQRALRHATAPAGPLWIDVALSAGYSDQAHFAREFRELAGVTPTEYRLADPAFANHVAIADDRRRSAG